jgi:hypothetical protein
MKTFETVEAVDKVKKAKALRSTSKNLSEDLMKVE